MGRFHSYLTSAAKIIQAYQGEEPCASFLKKFFSRHKKFGSNDRKQISHLCYCFFRLGKSFPQIHIEERILVALFFCSSESNDILEELRPEWNEKVKQATTEKYSMLSSPDVSGDLSDNVFPWKKELSEGIDHEEFCESFFVQPRLFLRIRPDHENVVKEKLLKAGIYLEEISGSCLSLPNTSKIVDANSHQESIIELDKEAVIQDWNSQRVGESFQSAIDSRSLSGLKSKIKVWDCCAASGGKSLLLYDINPNVDLTVSDIRQSILVNLKKRFDKAGIKNYKCYVADLTKPNLARRTWNADAGGQHPDQRRQVSRFRPKRRNIYHQDFDLIICDAPCTGSGTWSRTPEQLYFFDEEKIGYYASLQKKILSNVVPQLKRDGFLVYITCSVFRRENEEQVQYMMQELNLELIKTQLLTGYDKKADTLFVSILRKL
jgi:16S rRNA (cytosine967-C5)-methyltransferase